MAMRTITLGTFFGLKTTISPMGMLWLFLLIPIMGVLAAWTTSLSFGEAAVAGGLATIIMYLSEWAHQLGHALAARRVGYPMIGVHWAWLLSASVYPKDEPPLPPRIHIQRALGGFWINVVIGGLLAPLALYLWSGGGLWAWVAGFSAAYNFFILGLGALTPIDIPGVFTIDGGTIWHYWRESQKEQHP